MLVISKIFKSDSNGIMREQLYLSSSFVDNKNLMYNSVAHSVVLTNTETGKTDEIKANSLRELVGKLCDIDPYGFCEYNLLGGRHYFHTLIAVSSASLKFLEYVESVERISDTYSTIDLQDLSPWEVGSINSSLDEHNTLFNVYLYRDDGTAGLDNFVAYLTLFDAVCLYKKSVQKDGFYIPTFITKDEQPGIHVAYRVKCNDLAKAQSLVAKYRVMRKDYVKTFIG